MSKRGLRRSTIREVQKAAKLIKALVKDGFRPIVFCRYIPTADYVAEELRKALGKAWEVAAVTGLLPPAERETRVEALAKADKRVLVCTDCLSEGINLQHVFDAVVHYDLSWNPTRHEQRDGRVDRYGQSSPTVRVLTYYGIDNQVDGIVLRVLLRKHQTIRTALGVSIPVPADTETVMTALWQGALLQGGGEQLTLDLVKTDEEELHRDWDSAADREKRSRTMFAQDSIKPDEVAQELASVRRAIGSDVDVEWFVREVLAGYGARLKDTKDGTLIVDLEEGGAAARDAIRDHRDQDELRLRFALPVKEGVTYLQRTHPMVAGLGSHVLDTTLDRLLAGRSPARRAGVVRTRAVEKRTTALLLRLRYHIVTKRGTEERPLVAEDWRLIAFSGSPTSPEWLPDEVAENLILARSDANIPADLARPHVERVLEGLPALQGRLEEIAREHGKALLKSHRRVRRSTRLTGISQHIEPKLPVDVLGLYIYLPIGA